MYKLLLLSYNRVVYVLQHPVKKKIQVLPDGNTLSTVVHTLSDISTSGPIVPVQGGWRAVEPRGAHALGNRSTWHRVHPRGVWPTVP